MHIRQAEVADGGAIAALLTDLGYPITPDLLAQSIQRQLDHPDAVLLVAVAGDSPAGTIPERVVGVLSLHFIPQLAGLGDFCRISYFCVSPEARGQGVGAALEEYVCELARARGCDRMEVHCHSRRTQAHQFYFRQGYTESPKYLIKSLHS
jgi:GNAT superfamily N-acetyltransferase